MKNSDKRLVEIFERLNNVKLNLNENLNEKRKKASKNKEAEEDDDFPPKDDEKTDETPEKEDEKKDDTSDEKEEKSKKSDFDVTSDEDVNNLVQQKDDAGDVVKGGYGKDNTSTDFDFEQLKRGLKVELEHSDDPLVALDIAYDHLAEDPKYYGENEDDPDEKAKEGARKDV